MYADEISKAMKYTIDETRRRREIQDAYNKENNIIPKTVEKSVRDVIEATKADGEEGDMNKAASEMTKKELMKFVEKLEKEMKQAASDLQFERAAMLRDSRWL